MDNVNAEVVALVRQELLRQIGDHHSGQFEVKDIERFEKSDQFVWRFVDLKPDGDKVVAVKNAVKNMISCLQWRKDNRINDLKPSDFPQEMFDSGRVKVGWDTEGKFVVVDRVGLYRRNAEFHSLLFEIVAFDMERYDLPVNGSLYLDVSGAGYSSMDLQTSMTTADLLTKYYPNTFSNVYVYGIPSFVKPFFSLVLNVLPERYRKCVKFVDREEAMNRIKDLDIISPKGCSNLEEIGRKRGISEKAIQKEIKQQNWIREQCLKSERV
ncbi:Motile sperm domain-containing protein 2 [Halotydeus destructor]|nr:Motile sperm domain-containing protein 2 [Halotydeus destructor]